MSEVNDLTLMIDSPVAMNSMVMRLEGLLELYRSFEVSLYMARRFHMYAVNATYYDFEERRPVNNIQVYNFEQDIRDYITASHQAILVKYPKEHFQPILSSECVKDMQLELSAPRFY
jgi:hypothetical protein